MKKILAISLIALITSACVPTQNHMYYWGNYEKLLYDMYAKPGEAPPDLQIIKLTEDIQRADNAGLAVPPGLHAHLGFMYSAIGNVPQAKMAFLQEKQRFPESAVLIDSFLSRIEGTKPQ
ncbi:MAG: DUF4810 domain-containing protein [Spongiibacteraceae bacterium]